MWGLHGAEQKEDPWLANVESPVVVVVVVVTVQRESSCVRSRKHARLVGATCESRVIAATAFADSATAALRDGSACRRTSRVKPVVAAAVGAEDTVAAEVMRVAIAARSTTRSA